MHYSVGDAYVKAQIRYKAVTYRVRCYGNMHVFASSPDTVWCLVTIQQAIFSSDTGDPLVNENSILH